jgi:alpha-D-ribose 1-methylphosphonate 5-triphosphate synthase subunit PhnH
MSVSTSKPINLSQLSTELAAPNGLSATITAGEGTLMDATTKAIADQTGVVSDDAIADAIEAHTAVDPEPPTPDPLVTLLAALADAQSLEEVRQAAEAAGGV